MSSRQARPRACAVRGCTVFQWLSEQCSQGPGRIWTRRQMSLNWPFVERTRSRMHGSCILPQRSFQFYQTGLIKPALSKQQRSVGDRLEDLVHVLRILRSDSDFLILLAQFFLHECERVVARRQAFDFVLAVFIGHGEERAL